MKSHIADIAKSLFYMLITALAILALREMDNFSTAMGELTKGVGELNTKMGVVLEKLGNQDRSLTDHEQRLRKVERGG